MRPGLGAPGAVRLEGVGKRYVYDPHDAQLLLARLVRPRRRRAELWALRDVDLEVAAGETIGIIGRNGSGKTTLLRLLSGVSAPTVGRVRVEGNIAPLIGVGVGFDAELTGRENVFVNGQLLGLSSAQVAGRYADIVDFAEIGEFMSTPVKYYSSGMFLRLAFAVAVHTDPEVLLVDEVLAVGDMAFQQKCFDRMRAIQRGGATIVIVTHNLHSIDRLAPRTVLLSHGRKVFDGATEEAIGTYHELVAAEARDRGQETVSLTTEEGTVYVGGAVVTCSVRDGQDVPLRSVRTGDRVRLAVRVCFDAPVAGPLLGVLVSPVQFDVPTYMFFLPPGSYSGRHGPDRELAADIWLTVRMLAGGYKIVVGVHDGTGKAM
ncbi:MAG: ABC transporter ATP-binding protein, partial [Mycobacteriales bacterium]